ncbi:MAG: peptidylprolyl isomerase [Bacteroidales bacterium]|nr:peptidylprolyl isomerase [Bacteroidales bacterium]
MLKTGDTVKVHYTGKFEDGYVFDSTVANEPILFTIGDEMMIQGFEDAVRTMHVGQRKTVKLKPEEAYGTYDPNLIFVVKRSEVFGDKQIKKGDELQLPIEDEIYALTVIDIDGEEVKLDGNSEMAGRDVIFDIELLDVLDADDEGFGDFEDLEDFEEMDDNSAYY